MTMDGLGTRRFPALICCTSSESRAEEEHDRGGKSMWLVACFKWYAGFTMGLQLDERAISFQSFRNTKQQAACCHPFDGEAIDFGVHAGAWEARAEYHWVAGLGGKLCTPLRR